MKHYPEESRKLRETLQKFVEVREPAKFEATFKVGGSKKKSKEKTEALNDCINKLLETKSKSDSNKALVEHLMHTVDQALGEGKGE